MRINKSKEEELPQGQSADRDKSSEAVVSRHDESGKQVPSSFQP